MTAIATAAAPQIRRLDRFASVASTNDVVRDWLAAGEPEICVAIAGEQTAGRGRHGRTWIASPGRGLLMSLGFRPSWLAPDRVWRLAASVSLAMADAAEEATGLRAGSIGLKWPNDLVVTVNGAGGTTDGAGRSSTVIRKLGGVLGETDGLGTDDPRAIVGIGLNADWPADAFPVELRDSMTSLRAAAGDRAIDNEQLVHGFRDRLDARIDALHAGRFDATGWIERQVTTGRTIDVLLPDGSTETALAIGADADSGALRIAAPGDPRRERSILVGEVVRVRLAGISPIGL